MKIISNTSMTDSKCKNIWLSISSTTAQATFHQFLTLSLTLSTQLHTSWKSLSNQQLTGSLHLELSRLEQWKLSYNIPKILPKPDNSSILWTRKLTIINWWFQASTSQKRKNLYFWLCIPFVAKQHLMWIHQFVPLPLIHNFRLNYSLVPNVGHEDILAIPQTNYKWCCQLQTCRLAKTYGTPSFVHGEGSSRWIWSTHAWCLGALYLGSGNHMKNNSNFFITIAKSKSLILNEWAVYSTGTISTNEFCNDVSVIPKEIQSGDHIKIQPGC